MAFAHALAYVNTRVILTLVYLCIIGPIACIAWLMRADVLRKRIGSSLTFWQVRETAEHTLETAKRQF